MTTENKKSSVEEVNIVEKYNEFLDQIPWGSLQELPKKLEKWAPFVGIKDPKDLDIAAPIRDVVEFIGILVLRLRKSEKRSERLEKELNDLRMELNKVNS